MAALEQPSGGSPASPCRAASVKLRRNEECFLNQTANYQLSQWESTDRILMADFNSDNAKIDAALKGLADRTGIQQLYHLELTEPYSSRILYVPLEDVEWSKWNRLHIYAAPALPEGTTYFNAFFNNTSTYTLQTQMGEALYMTIQSLRGEAPFIHGMFWSDEGCSLFGFPILTFARLESLALVSPTVDTFDPGTVVTVWGEP